MSAIRQLAEPRHPVVSGSALTWTDTRARYSLALAGESRGALQPEEPHSGDCRAALQALPEEDGPLLRWARRGPRAHEVHLALLSLWERCRAQESGEPSPLLHVQILGGLLAEEVRQAAEEPGAPVQPARLNAYLDALEALPPPFGRREPRIHPERALLAAVDTGDPVRLLMALQPALIARIHAFLERRMAWGAALEFRRRTEAAARGVSRWRRDALRAQVQAAREGNLWEVQAYTEEVAVIQAISHADTPAARLLARWRWSLHRPGAAFVLLAGPLVMLALLWWLPAPVQAPPWAAALLAAWALAGAGYAYTLLRAHPFVLVSGSAAGLLATVLPITQEKAAPVISAGYTGLLGVGALGGAVFLAVRLPYSTSFVDRLARTLGLAGSLMVLQATLLTVVLAVLVTADASLQFLLPATKVVIGRMPLWVPDDVIVQSVLATALVLVVQAVRTGTADTGRRE